MIAGRAAEPLESLAQPKEASIDGQHNNGNNGELEPRKPKVWPTGSRDNPEQYPTDNQSLFDMYESELNVDPIPVEDVNMEQREQKDKDRTKAQSSSEKKYK